MTETEVEVQSGYVTGRRSILTAARTAAVRSVLNGAIDTAEQIAPTVAKDRGIMREGVQKGIKRSGFRFSVNKAKITVKGTEVLKLMKELGPEHLAYHVRQDSKFNPAFSLGYKNPSTEGTRPIDMNTVMKAYATNVRNLIKKELRKQGVKVS